MDKNTFGKTPAAEYLVRVLTELNDQTLTRSVGKRITATNAVVADLVEAYESGWISAKTLANTMRLMRDEVTNEFNQYPLSKSKEALVDKLRRNVQIGYIKKAIRQATVARKCETVMTAPNRKGISLGPVDNVHNTIGYFDLQLNRPIVAGWHGNGYYASRRCVGGEDEYVTPELLHERSLKRCIRLGKPHTK